jgi:4-hydroxy-4-methyl-2-oxoglutarate aldolase
MQPQIRTEIPRTDAKLVNALREQGVATVHEAMNRKGLMAPRMRPIRDGISAAGPAVTSLNHPGDNLMVHAALSVCQPGDMLVVATTVPCACGMIGELMTRQAQVRGINGIIIDSGVRDVVDLRSLGLPIWSSAITAAGSVKATPGWVNVPMTCGDATVNPGDIVIADDDGVVVVPLGDAEHVLEAAEQRTAKETASRKRIEAGELSFDMQNMRGYLAERGVVISR